VSAEERCLTPRLQDLRILRLERGGALGGQPRLVPSGQGHRGPALAQKALCLVDVGRHECIVT
jgi:hypothetical protein